MQFENMKFEEQIGKISAKNVDNTTNKATNNITCKTTDNTTSKTIEPKAEPKIGKKNWGKTPWIVALAALTLLAAAGATVFAASGYGTLEDPLITYSYLEEVLTPQLNGFFDDRLSQAMGETTESGVFELVSLDRGQRLMTSTGSEMILRSGSAAANGGTSPVLLDVTDGSALEQNAALQLNHMVLSPNTNNGLIAMSDEVEVLVSGTYSIR